MQRNLELGATDMADDQRLSEINDEFADYIRDIPRKDTSKAEIDGIKDGLRDILAEYQMLVGPG